jgi:superfamily II DNA/RNA helicase
MDDILRRKAAAAAAISTTDGLPQQQTEEEWRPYQYARALILVPNKELVQQVVRMAIPLAGGPEALVYGGWTVPDATKLVVQNDATTTSSSVLASERINLAIMPGGLRDPKDFEPFRKSPPPDLVISTPAAIGPLALSPKHMDMFTDIATVVIDEADMLLDGGYLGALENVLMGFRRADRADRSAPPTQHVFVAATLPNYGLRSVDAYLQRKFPRAQRIALDGMHKARHSGLAERTVWICEDTKKERLQQLIALLNEKKDKTMVFLNSVDEVEAATKALLRDGQRVLPYHAQISLQDRANTLDRFRRHTVAGRLNNSDDDGERKAMEYASDDTVPTLVCTDLASRGLDVPGVTLVVQLQCASNVVAHLHRMGRCGRAGQRTGRGVVFYGAEEREWVETVRRAEDQQEQMVLEQDVAETVDALEKEANNNDPGPNAPGTVNRAFSRRRGFRKKLKKLRLGDESAPGQEE